MGTVISGAYPLRRCRDGLGHRRRTAGGGEEHPETSTITTGTALGVGGDPDHPVVRVDTEADPGGPEDLGGQGEDSVAVWGCKEVLGDWDRGRADRMDQVQAGYLRNKNLDDSGKAVDHLVVGAWAGE